MDIFENTEKFLLEIKEAGYHKVTIGKPSNENPACDHWMNGPTSVWGWHPSFKGMYNDKLPVCRKNGWPSIWEIVGKYKIKDGCANGHQCQITKYRDVLIEGTFDTTSIESIKKGITDIKCKMFVERI